MASLRVGWSKCFLRDLALMLPRAFILGGGLVDVDLSKDNSSSVGASPSLEITGSYPLLQTIGGSAQLPSRTSFPSSRLFSTWDCN